MTALQVCTRAESQGETTRHGEAFTSSSGVVLAFKRVTNSDQSSTGESGRKRQRSHISDENEEAKRFCRLIKRKAWINPDCGFESSSDDGGSSALLQDNIIFSEVVGKWDPDASCAPVVDDGDSFYPDEEEFHDTLKYIRSIHSEAEANAICRVVPPRTWRPPCAFKECMEIQKKVFSTKVQWIHQHIGIQKSANAILHYDFEPGPDFTLQNFKAFDSKFKMHYFSSNLETHSNDPSVEAIEGEYWRIVEHPNEQIKVLYASMSSDKFGSGFSTSLSGNGKASVGSYDTSGWNLNNTAHLPGAFGSTELSIPRLHIGMCFSFSPWRIEENLLYSLNYLHCGAPRIWYGVPSDAASRFEDFMMKQAQAEPNDPHQIISPSSLKAAGIPVYRIVQRPGDFVITFSNVYYSNISCGFNCAEVVNIAPVDQSLQCISKGTIRLAIPSANEKRDNNPALNKVNALSGDIILLSDDEGDELKTEDAAHQGNMECQSTLHGKSDKNECLSRRDINGSEALSKREKLPAILLNIDLKNPVVELVDVGKLVQRDGWCNKDTILPLGFKSRTCFYNYLDLPRTCYYISEIVDCGKGKPYFKVTMDGHPEESYTRPSMDKCWEQVHLRVNSALEERCCPSLPQVQSNAICGLNMFGLKQPSIIKAVEALDLSHYCCSYWTGKSSGPFRATSGHQSIPDYSSIYDTLRPFFARGSQKELWALQKIFSSDWKGQDWKDAFQALVDQLETMLERDCHREL